MRFKIETAMAKLPTFYAPLFNEVVIVVSMAKDVGLDFGNMRYASVVEVFDCGEEESKGSDWARFSVLEGSRALIMTTVGEQFERRWGWSVDLSQQNFVPNV